MLIQDKIILLDSSWSAYRRESEVNSPSIGFLEPNAQRTHLQVSSNQADFALSPVHLTEPGRAAETADWLWRKGSALVGEVSREIVPVQSWFFRIENLCLR